MTSVKILILEQGTKSAGIIENELRKGGIEFRAKQVNTEEMFIEELVSFRPDIVLADFSLPTFDERRVLRATLETVPRTPFIFVCDGEKRGVTVDLLEAGATDYTIEDDLLRLPFAVTRALQEVREREELRKTWGEKKVEEEALRRQAELLDLAKESIVVTDMDGTIIFWNAGARETYGWEKEEALGKGKRYLLQSQFPSNLADIRATLLVTGRWEGEVFNWTKTGKRIVVESRWALQKDESGEPIAILEIGNDISQRKWAEEELRRLASVIEQGSEMVIITDEDGITQYVNPAFEKASGYSRQEVLGRHIRLLKRGEHDEAFYETMWNTLREGKVWKGGMTHEKKDGKLQELDMTLWPIRDATGSIVNYVSVSRDMTNEVRLAEQLRQKQKMEAIGTLAGGIAHDFNNILAAIIGNAELGLDDPGTSLGTNHNLEQILKAGKRGRDLVKQILMFSRKETKERQTVKLTPIIDDTIKLIRASLPTMINIVFEPRASLDTALANPSQMQQVLMNLASNAAHAMRENGGVLEISVYNQELSKRSLPDAIMNPGQYVVMAVRDTGPGIDQTVRKRIFEPFFTTKEPGQGTGMGLAVAYGIVNSHQGTITVSSQTGKGSTFKVFLPAVSVSKVSVDEVATQQAAPKGNERILFVDDEEALAELSGTILSRLGYEVTTKTNPIEALSFFAQNPDRLDLVIVDQTMPDMTGMSLAREMMRIRPDIPMILSTGYSDLVSPETARAAGIAEFLMKPVERNVLADTVRTVLDGKSGK